MVSKHATARMLAQVHANVEQNLRLVRLIEPLGEGDPGEPIKLLEVVEGTIERGIEPISFRADPAHGVPYPSVVVEVSPAEYHALAAQYGPLDGRPWTLGEVLWPEGK